MRCIVPLLLALAVAAAAQDPAPPAPPPRRTSFQAAVNAAVERGVAWLEAKQGPDGNWKDGPSAEYPMGVTALATLALLRSDVAPEHPAVLKALAALKSLPIDRTYSTGLLLQVLDAAKAHQRHAEWAQRAADFLVKTQRPSGLWAYPDKDPDLSNAQFAVFGLFAASRMGVAVPREAFARFAAATIALQGKDGGFPYSATSMDTGSMTAAGTAALLACRQIGQKLKAPMPGLDVAVSKGEEWLGRRFRADRNPSGPTDGYQPNRQFWFYYLYVVERAAVLGGRPKLGEHDWYREGATTLIRQQNADGHWGDVVNTSFALLFLKRASLTYSPHAKEFADDPKLLLPIEDDPAPPDRALEELKISGPVPFLRSWVTLGPFPNPGDTLLFDDLIKESQILPFPTLRTGKLEWKELQSGTDSVDLDKAISKQDDVVGYACCYLWADSDQDAVLWFGSDDGAKVMLNRETVLYDHRHDATPADASRVRVKLKKGRNVLLVKIEELRYFWGFHARLTDASGKVLPVRISIRPEK
jgi:hypothetical protein